MSALVITGEANVASKLWKTALADEAEASPEDEQFWLVLVPVDGDESNGIYGEIADWAAEQEIYFDVVHSDSAECSLEGGQVFPSDDPYNFAVERAASENDTVKILALFNDDSPDELADFLAEQWTADVMSYNLANGMDPFEFNEDDDEEGDEPEEEDVEEETAEAGEGYTEAELEAKKLTEVRTIASAMGFDAAKATKPDLIAAILEEQAGKTKPEPAPKKAAAKRGSKATPKSSVADADATDTVVGVVLDALIKVFSDAREALKA